MRPPELTKPTLARPGRDAKSSKLRLVASAADQLEGELARLEQQRNRYVMAAEMATDPKVSVGHLRNVERLEEEIEALQKALEAMPSPEESAGDEAAEPSGEGDDEQTRVFDAEVLASASAAPPTSMRPLAKPRITGALAPVPDDPPRFATTDPPETSFAPEFSSPFGRRIQEPISTAELSSSGLVGLDLPRSNLRRVAAVVLGMVVLGVVVAAVWFVLEPQAQPRTPEPQASTPTVIEAAPVPSDTQHR
jgi:hypothetical protein